MPGTPVIDPHPLWAARSLDPRRVVLVVHGMVGHRLDALAHGLRTQLILRTLELRAHLVEAGVPVRYPGTSQELREPLSRLREQGRDQVVVCGLYTRAELLATVLDAAAHGTEIFPVAEAVVLTV